MMTIPKLPFQQRIFRTKTLFDIGSGEGAGLAALDERITVNGITVTNTFRYEGKNATTALWTATTGENLTGQGSGGIAGLDTPLPGTVDEAFDGNTVRWFQASDSSYGDVETEDFIVEAVWWEDGLSTGALSGKYLAGDAGWLLYSAGTSGRKDLRLLNGAAGVNIVLAGLTTGCWYHAVWVAHRAGSGVAFLNGDMKTPASLATVTGSLVTGDPMGLLAYGLLGTGPSACKLAHLAMWQRANWLSTHDISTIVQERFHRLTGVYSERFGSPTHTSLRNSNATLEKQGNVGYQRLFTVGPRWPRIETLPDKNGRYGTGLLVEGAHTNYINRSEELDHAFWTKSGVSIVPDSIVAPNGLTVGDTVHEDGLASAHFVRAQWTSAATTTYVWQCYVHAGFRTRVRLKIYSATDGTAQADFDIVNGTRLGQSATDSYGSRYLGDGWYHLWMVDTRATSEAHFAYAYALDDTGAESFTGADQDSFYMWGSQVSIAPQPVSYVKTVASADVRLQDIFQYSFTSKFPFTVCGDTMPRYLGGNATNYWAHMSDGTNDERISLTTNNTGYTYFYGMTGAVGQWAIIQPPALQAFRWHSLRQETRENDVHGYVDGSLVGSDSSCTMPTINQLRIGGFSSAGYLNGHIRLRVLSKMSAGFEPADFGDIMSKASGYISATAAVAQSTSYANVGGTFTSVDLTDFTLSAAGVFTYTGTDTKRFVVSASMSGSISAGTPEVSTTLEKNGSPVTSSLVKRDVSTTGIGAWAIQADVEMATNDTLNFATKVDTGTPNLTMETLSCVIHEF